MTQESFLLAGQAFDPRDPASSMKNPAAGGFRSFEGWVRTHNEGKAVISLEYEAYPDLANREGNRIIDEAFKKFDIIDTRCVHRTGHLQVGEIAVWVGVTAKHRQDAFRSCRYIIDEVKARVPIWKKEHYADGHSGWVRCEHCEAHVHRH